MMDEKRMKLLMDATGGIREEYIEEAVAKPWNRSWFVRVAAAAAALALMIGSILFLWPEEEMEPVPFFAIRAYAAGGSTAVLDDIGDVVRLKNHHSELFPDRKVYIIDVSLDDYAGDPGDLSEDRFWVSHSMQSKVKPGESDGSLAVEWLTREEDGFFGYRITGWCEDRDFVHLRIYDKNRTVLHEKKLYITFDNGYKADVIRSFYYHPDMTTDELIDETFHQDYIIDCMLSSDLLQRGLKDDCGFFELINRPDAASRLLDRLERIVAGECLYPVAVAGYGEFGVDYSNDWLIPIVLLWPECQEQMTDSQKEQFEILYDTYMEMQRSKKTS